MQAGKLLLGEIPPASTVSSWAGVRNLCRHDTEEGVGRSRTKSLKSTLLAAVVIGVVVVTTVLPVRAISSA